MKLSANAKPFRMKVIEEYGSVAAFAKAANWSARKASYVTRGIQDLTAKDVETCADVLGVNNANEFMRIFYPMLSIKWTTEKGA